MKRIIITTVLTLIIYLSITNSAASAEKINIYFEELSGYLSSSENKITGFMQISNTEITDRSLERFSQFTIRDERTYALTNLYYLDIDVNSRKHVRTSGKLSGSLSVSFDQSSRGYEVKKYAYRIYIK